MYFKSTSFNRLQVTPVSHPASIVDYSDTKELELLFETHNPVSLACSLTHHHDSGKQEDCSDFAFKTQTKENAKFALKFQKQG